jgi:hypothetical protein
MVANFYQQEYDMYYGHFNFENGYILVVLFIATPAKTKSLFKYCIKITRADFVFDQLAHLFTFSFSANHNAGNEKFTPRRARKYCRLLGLP